MKSKYLTSLLLATCLVAGTGCKKWLDVQPKSEIRERELFTSESGFKDALIGTYQLLATKPAYGENLTMGFVDGLAQRYASTSTSQTFYFAARYDYTNTKTYIRDIWSTLYKAIANVDNLLAQIDDKKNIFLGNNFNLVKGEALALRALLHFDLLRLFGAAPVIDGGNRKSIPYVTTFGLETYPLLTTNEVIANCLTDLDAAAELLRVDKTIRVQYNDDPFLSYTRNHMNYWAVKGLQARINLYKGDKPAAAAAALEVIANAATNFPFVVPANASAATNRDRTYTSELLFSLYAYKISDYVDEYFKTVVINGTPALYTTSSNIASLYETASGSSSDMRYNYLFTQYTAGFSSIKYWQDDIAKNNSNYDYLRGNIPIIRLSEMYYIAAECAATTAEGVAYLNTIRDKRGLFQFTTNISAATLETEILKEYKKEMYAEGQLFYYFKRKNTTRVDGSSIIMTDATWILPLPDDEKEFANRF
ncbi:MULTISPECIES: RagB/SusD family nutrient uptake outer membrane protein [Niastella]|uniref:RagB/SusD family nutrient uptake outer membrane protein n=1 Tax=Niastella soli TaxID=2821487 RepID=A0ABS3YV14_9BACT|nr:RagB/SusD family nutrient uptake outer membrane protein [Niastella soli]MBO9201598.1 RagB/SusD family nutrient uptake outer membrane protein [Niastella soli]